MKKSVVLFFILIGTLNILGQNNTSIPKPEVLPTPEFKDTREEDFQKRMRDMKNAVQNRNYPSAAKQLETLEEEKRRIDALLAPHPDDLTKYKTFLEQSKTGIFRLMPDYGCESKNTLRVGGICEHHIPGKWAYSFRLRDYSNEVFHDIWFTEGTLVSEGFLSQGILSNLGDVPLQNVSLSSNEMKYLAEFDPATDRSIIKDQYQMISKGFEKDGLYYSNQIKIGENTTYVLRIIAYRLEDKFFLRKQAKTSADKEKVFFLKYDKRNDSIFAFRVIRKGDDGGITILWKEILRQKSPKIVFKKNEKLADFKN